MHDTLTPTLRLVDLLDSHGEALVDPQVIAQAEAALAQTGRVVDRTVLIALARQQQALEGRALALVRPAATPKVRRKGWRLGVRWRWWWRGYQRREAARRVRAQAHAADLQAQRQAARTWEDRLEERKGHACVYRSIDVVPPLALAYHAVRSQRRWGLAAAETNWQGVRAVWKLMTKATAAHKHLPLSETHWTQLAQGFTQNPGAPCWVVPYSHDDPKGYCYGRAPLLLDTVRQRIHAFFQTQTAPNYKADLDEDDLVLFDAVVDLGADPDLVFGDDYGCHLPLPDRCPTWPAMSGREVLLFACQHGLLQCLRIVHHAPIHPLDSWLWWVVRARQVKPDPLFTELLRDEPERILHAVGETLRWVLAHEEAPAIHECLLKEAIAHETNRDLKQLWAGTLYDLQQRGP